MTVNPNSHLVLLVYITGSARCTAARVVDTMVSDHRPLLVDLIPFAARPELFR